MSAYQIEAWHAMDVPTGPPHLSFQAGAWDDLRSFLKALDSEPRWARLVLTDRALRGATDRTISIASWTEVAPAADAWADSDPLGRPRTLTFVPCR